MTNGPDQDQQPGRKKSNESREVKKDATPPAIFKLDLTRRVMGRRGGGELNGPKTAAGLGGRDRNGI